MIWYRPIDLERLNADGVGTLIEHLGISFIEVTAETLAATMPVDARTRQPFGLLHGGASVALAETVSSVAGTATLDPETAFVVGMEINANHLRPVKSGVVRAVAEPEALGRTVQVWSIRITDPDGRTICISRATLAVRARRG